MQSTSVNAIDYRAAAASITTRFIDSEISAIKYSFDQIVHETRSKLTTLYYSSSTRHLVSKQVAKSQIDRSVNQSVMQSVSQS